MSSAVVGALRVDLGLDAAAFTNNLKGAQKGMRQAGDQMKSVGAGIGKAVGGIAVAFAGMATIAGGALAGVGAALSGITKDLVELSAEAKTAGMSFEAFQTWQYVAKQANVSIDALTDGFKEMALRADEFATTGGGSAAEAFQRIGLSGAQLTEALKDPSAMFDDILARMQKLDTAAQIRVADEIFGGTGGEQFVRLLSLGGDEIAKMREQFVAGGGLIPEAQVEKARAFQQAIDRVKASFSGMAINALMDSGLVEWFTEAIPKVAEFAKAAQSTFGPAMAAMQKHAAAVAPVLAGIGKAFMEGLGPMIPPLLKAVQDAFVALMPAVVELGKIWSATLGPVLLTALRAVAATVTSVFSIVGQALRVVTALLKGDWSGAWNAAGSLVMEVLRSIARIADSLFPGILDHVRKMVMGVTTWLSGRLFGVLEGVIAKVKTVSDAFFRLYDAVVGHSFIPDLVEGVAEWMAKLDAGMVRPAVAATDATKAAFEKLRDDVAAIMESLLTDSERAARELANKTKTIRDGVAAGLLTTNQGAQAEAGIAGQNLTMPDTIGPISPIDTSSVQDAMNSIAAGIEATRESFAEAFSYGIDSAIRGDWQGVLTAIVGDSFSNGLKSIGRSLFDALGKGSSGGAAGGGFNLGSIGKAISGMFGNIPGYSRGGSFGLPAT